MRTVCAAKSIEASLCPLIYSVADLSLAALSYAAGWEISHNTAPGLREAFMQWYCARTKPVTSSKPT